MKCQYACVADAMQKILNLHREQTKVERDKFYLHNLKSIKGKNGTDEWKYVSIIIDGMDQAKTILPHYERPPKYIDGKQKIEMHLNGVIVAGHGVSGVQVYHNFKQSYSDDSNMLATLIDLTLHDVQAKRKAANARMPEVLYIQLDNVSHNKNRWVFAYCAWLVHTGVLKKVKISYLIVGHTHEIIDQFFSRLSVRLRDQRCFTVPQLMACIIECSTPTPTCHELPPMMDIKRKFNKIPLPHYTSEHQVFRLKKNADGHVVMHTKQYTNTQQYNDEVDLLSHAGPLDHVFYKVEPKPYPKVENHLYTTEAQRTKLLKTTLLQKTLDVLVEEKPDKFDAEAERWWREYIEKHKCMEDAPAAETEAPAQPLYDYVPLASCDPLGTEVTAPPPVATAPLEYLLEKTFPVARPVTFKRASSAKTKRCSADPADLKVGHMMIVRPAPGQADIPNAERTGDVATPMWMGRVVGVNESDMRKITVHWYGAEKIRGKAAADDEWLTWKWEPRFQSTNKRKPVTSELDRYRCGLLVYDFSLRTSTPKLTLRQSTVKLLRQLWNRNDNDEETETDEDDEADEDTDSDFDEDAPLKGPKHPIWEDEEDSDDDQPLVKGPKHTTEEDEEDSDDDQPLVKRYRTS
jgi:hypothetical protein